MRRRPRAPRHALQQLGTAALLAPALVGLAPGACLAKPLSPAQSLVQDPLPAQPALAQAPGQALGQAPEQPSPAAPASHGDVEDPASLSAEELRSEEALLAKELSNPVASLVSLPFQFNLDQRLGPQENVQRANLNIQPVFPVELSSNWNLISRTILPVLDYQGEAGPETGQINIGDTQQSLFFSPARFGANAVIWGVGPVALLPTATSNLSGLHQWGLGPTGVALVQRGNWSVGALVNHLWSVANNGEASNLNATYLQPFISYSTAGAWTISLNSESTYDWPGNSWSIPVNLTVSKVTKVGNQLLSVGARARYWAASPEAGPHGWGGRVFVTLLFPKR